jgi:hypothetical protein
MEPVSLEHSIEIYIGLTVILGGAAAYLMGRNFAENWRPAWTLLLATPALALGVRFLHFALFHEPLLTPWGYLADAVTLLVFGLIGFRLARTQAMVTRYYWLYEKTSPFTWRDRQTPG